MVRRCLLLLLIGPLVLVAPSCAPQRAPELAHGPPQYRANARESPSPVTTTLVAPSPPRYNSQPSPHPAVLLPAHLPPSTGLPAGLLCIRLRESTDNYRAASRYGDFGAYQYKTGTWAGYGGYARADLAPSAIQDERALADYNRGPAARHGLWPATSRRCGV